MNILVGKDIVKIINILFFCLIELDYYLYCILCIFLKMFKVILWLIRKIIKGFFFFWEYKIKNCMYIEIVKLSKVS